MFTLLPSLYLIGIDYFRQWKTPYYYEQNKSISKTYRKVKLHRNRRWKTSIDGLSDDEIIHLINETGLTREKILVWYKDFLVC
jgi:hypothetical protein